ncbi:asparaginase-domain-containing protein [Dacryopinax primogenitus]|uniref:asparaginase n=1 Tax=Dacryopinax primogenitus (strain DJM 731) TaxID=1858805 RepID=M5GGI9_DACPD|nr:asparaginase-domain-containing protein [Dacryopinax primogenitus]EJU05568.1 asparaginase-domain-containing protein [Dacryopinax primogenitus]
MSRATSAESRVLVIYTGGTIGMVLSGQGYTPEPNLLTESLRTQTRFHDPLGTSLFSNAESSTSFKTWAASQASSRAATPHSFPGSVQEPSSLEAHGPTLLVRSSRPIMINGSQTHNTAGISSTGVPYYEKHMPSLITPSVHASGDVRKRIHYAILEWQPLLDSSNMELSDWIRIATEIELNYHNFDAFVVLHGTDTMCYSSSALSFMLEDLGKTVILTGAQIPLSQLRNDAVENLLGALSIAGHYIIPECCLYFNHKLFRGNRVTKVSADDFDAFDSPNLQPLVEVGINIEVNWSSVLRPMGSKAFRVQKQMCSDVASLRLFPGITGSIIRAFLAPPLEGVVLETFGAGNAPNRPDVLDAIKEATSRGVVIVAISQCHKGAVSDSYQTGRALLDLGVIPGADMTPECALTKLAYLLSKRMPVDEVRGLVGVPLRGELTVPTDETTFSTAPNHTLDIMSSIMRLSSDRPKPPRRQQSMSAPVALTTTADDQQAGDLAMLPFLAQLAVARDDVETLDMCLHLEEELSGSNSMQALGSPQRQRRQGPSLVNQLDVASGRTLLHIAALQGSVACTQQLLDGGALVHMRDALDHTALYYAARRGHTAIVLELRKAGGHLYGADIDEGYADLAFRRAREEGDREAMRTWVEAGFKG